MIFFVFWQISRYFCRYCWKFYFSNHFIVSIKSINCQIQISGIAISLNYVFGFLSKKTYFDMETTLSLAGTTSFYSAVCCAGLIYAYFTLPETEGRSLEDIELHFSDNSKKLTDRNIVKTSNLEQNVSDLKRHWIENFVE